MLKSFLFSKDGCSKVISCFSMLYVTLVLVLFPLSHAFSKKASVKKPKVPYASIVVEASTGRILHAANADHKVFPASLTKMMTLYLTFKALKQGKLSLHQSVPISARAQRQAPSKLGLRKGEMLTVHQAILALVTKSANDVAVALAEKLGGTEDHFALLMTQQARVLGMNQTRFYNASGLPNALQKTTARDMATLSQALWKDFQKNTNDYFKTQAFYFRGVMYKTHNHLLGTVPGVDGMKTGYICASGFNLAASAKRNNQRLIVVVMGGKTRLWRDKHTTELINTAFTAPENLASVTIVPQLQNGFGSPTLPSYAESSIPSLISRAAASSLPHKSLHKRTSKRKKTRPSISHLIEQKSPFMLQSKKGKFKGGSDEKLGRKNLRKKAA